MIHENNRQIKGDKAKKTSMSFTRKMMKIGVDNNLSLQFMVRMRRKTVKMKPRELKRKCRPEKLLLISNRQLNKLN